MTAKFVTVEQLRHQLELAPDEGNDDMLQLYANAGEMSMITRLRRKVYETEGEIPLTIDGDYADETDMVINDSIRMAILMMAASLDQSREFNSAIMVYKVPHTLELLLDPWIIMRGIE